MYDRTSLDASGEFVINELPRRRADKISFSLFDSAKTNVGRRSEHIRCAVVAVIVAAADCRDSLAARESPLPPTDAGHVALMHEHVPDFNAVRRKIFERHPPSEAAAKRVVY